MSSILTNNSAMTALQTLRGINKSLQMTQSEISTGKRIPTSKENAAIWSVAAVMQSDVSGFKGVADALSLGASTVSVARAGAETTVDLLNQMKERIVAAQADNVDRGKIDADVQALKAQIGSTVEGSQFNGANLLKQGEDLEVLSSLNRGSTGVEAANIAVARQTLEVSSNVNPFASVNLGTGPAVTNTNGVFADQMFQDGAGAAAEDTVVATFANANFNNDDTSVSAGDTISLTVGETTVSYTITESDLAPDTGVAADDQATRAGNVMDGLRTAFNDAVTAGQITNVTLTETTAAASGTDGVLTLDNGNDTALDFSISFGGGLSGLATLNVTDETSAAAALSAIDGLIETATSAAASFGSAQKRIETQQEFVKNLSDNLVSGIGALVDADMEETSARLQALQVQQQLGVQSLSIANQQPQTLLSLFR
jgi:flagellin